MARSFGFFMLFHLSPTCTESGIHPFKSYGQKSLGEGIRIFHKINFSENLSQTLSIRTFSYIIAM